MTVVEWPGIPERYWPDTEKPWRLTWGFGVFEDFASRDAAFKEYRRMLREEAHLSPNEPFNALEVERDE